MIYNNVELYNVAEILPSEDGDGKLISRIPNKLRLTLNPNAKLRALYSAGCEIRFNLEGDSAKIILSCENPSIVEVFQGSFLVSWHIVGKKPTEIRVCLPQNIRFLDRITREKNLPFDAHLTRVILPHRLTWLFSIEGETSPPREDQTPKKKYLAYGSSITQGASSYRPTGTYAMRTAQRLAVDLLNLGFGGGAHCEPQLADYIAERRDWDFATLEMGINMFRNFSVEKFRRRVEYFVERIAKSHPDKWVFCIDLFTFSADFDPSVKKHQEFRNVVKETVENLNMPKLIHIDGRNLLKNVSGLTSDLVHPAPSGMEEIAYNLSNLIEAKINGD